MSDHKAWQAAADAVEAAYFAGFHVRDAEIERLRGLLKEWVVMLDGADFPETFVEAVVSGKPSLVDKTNEAIGRIAETGGWGWEE
jgi:hypothetical protein